MVTFKQTDPLFVIDLKDPKRPTVLGELKIPGFSNYLHPYDANTMIGIGKDTDVNEWGGVTTRAIKLSLFDVSDVSSPKEIDTYVMGDRGSDSIALYDHKAFLFSRDKNLLAIPVSLQNSGEFGWSKLTFTGAAVFNITRDGFKLSGKIDHSDGGRISNQDYWGGYTYYDNTVKRSLYINDALYTFSNKYLKKNKTEIQSEKIIEKVDMEELENNYKNKISNIFSEIETLFADSKTGNQDLGLSNRVTQIKDELIKSIVPSDQYKKFHIDLVLLLSDINNNILERDASMEQKIEEKINEIKIVHEWIKEKNNTDQ